MNRQIPTHFPNSVLDTVSEIGKMASKLQGRDVGFSVAARRLMALGAKTALNMSEQEFNQLMEERS